MCWTWTYRIRVGNVPLHNPNIPSSFTTCFIVPPIRRLLISASPSLTDPPTTTATYLGSVEIGTDRFTPTSSTPDGEACCNLVLSKSSGWRMIAEVNPLSAPAERWCTALDLPLPFRSTATFATATSGTSAVLGIDVIGAELILNLSRTWCGSWLCVSCIVDDDLCVSIMLDDDDDECRS